MLVAVHQRLQLNEYDILREELIDFRETDLANDYLHQWPGHQEAKTPEYDLAFRHQGVILLVAG